MPIDLSERLSAVRLPGIRDLAASILEANIDMSMGEASEFTVTISDGDGAIIEAAVAKKRARIFWGDLAFTVTGTEHGPREGAMATTITARSAGWQALKARKGDRTWRGLSPTQVVKSECDAVGLKLIGQQTASRSSISRLAEGADRKSTSTLELIDRLAGENGFVYADVAGVFYFGAPSWLVRRTGWAISGTDPSLTERPTCVDTLDDKKEPARITLKVAANRPQELLLPASPVQVTGVPRRYRGRYLVTNTSISLTSGNPATIELSTPVDPEKQK